MNKQRAQEIASSGDMIKVTYQGTPVFIQHVDEQSETARIYPLAEPEREQTVSLNELEEQ